MDKARLIVGIYPLSFINYQLFRWFIHQTKSKKFDVLETRGNGEPLILIPGFASGAWTWFRQVEELSKDLSVITFDPRGIGKSKRDENDLQNLSLKTFVEDVNKFARFFENRKSARLGRELRRLCRAGICAFVSEDGQTDFGLHYGGGKHHVKPDIEILRSFTPDPTLPLGEVFEISSSGIYRRISAKYAGELKKSVLDAKK